MPDTYWTLESLIFPLEKHFFRRKMGLLKKYSIKCRGGLQLNSQLTYWLNRWLYSARNVLVGTIYTFIHPIYGNQNQMAQSVTVVQNGT